MRTTLMSQSAATKLQPIAEPAQLDEILDWDVAPIQIDLKPVSVRVKVVDADSPVLLPH